MKRTIHIPKFILQGIKRNHRSTAREVLTFGGDTETVRGEPHTLQISHKGATDLYYVNRRNILPTFLDHVDNVLGRGEWGVVYFHFLPFDLPVLFKDENPNIWQASNFTVEREGWKCYVNCEKRFFAKLCKDRHKIIYIVDSFAYLPTSLDKIGKMLVPDLPKLKKPKGLGSLPLRTAEFENYAKRDAVIEDKFGKWIYDIHKRYDIRISVSLPQMAAFIFRHKFLKEDDIIDFPPHEVVAAAVSSYHGGKNGLYVPAGVYENCSEVDLNSAYAWAMKQLPSFLKGYYKRLEEYQEGICAVYNLSGEINCPYNIFFNDEFKPIHGKFKNIWVTSYELAEALKYKEVKITNIYGYGWFPQSKRNPIGDYVDHFYELKNKTPKTNPMYNFYKLCGNSLYGKFIQAVEVRDTEGAQKFAKENFDFEVTEEKGGKLKVKEGVKVFNAGGLFNPFLATAITGMVRARIHDLEHRFKALHTATDSIKTLMPISGTSDELGGYKLEVKGNCVLLRNKLYLHFNEDGLLTKYALHGFQGKVGELLEMVVKKQNDYQVRHIFKVREAIRQRKEALTMLTVDKSFHFDWKGFDDKGFSYRKKEIKDNDGELQKTLYYGKINNKRGTKK